MTKDSIQHHAAAEAPGRWPRRPWLAAGMRTLVLVLLLAPFGLGGAESAALEYKVKAGYLFNFAKYIEWPTNAFRSTNSPFVIGVLDAAEASPVLRAVFEGKKVDGRPVEVRAVFAETIGSDVHLLMVTRMAGHTPEELRRFAGSAPVLIVGETNEFAERGGAIGFVHEGESVRLTLCREHAAAAGLKVSAKLSSVARSVKSKFKK
jgi:hypothetical protein